MCGGAPELASFLFHSLAARYAEVLRMVAEITGKRLRRLYIFGGGSQNEFLNRADGGGYGAGGASRRDGGFDGGELCGADGGVGGDAGACLGGAIGVGWLFVEVALGASKARVNGGEHTPGAKAPCH